jgi:hypothetical protein
MKKLLAVVLFNCIAACGQTSTKQPAVSDVFAKVALHVLIAMRNSRPPYAIQSQHLATLFEDLEVEAATPTEKQLTKYFAFRNTLRYEHLDAWKMEAARHPEGWHNFDFGPDDACFDAYINLLKANDSKTNWDAIPSACSIQHVAAAASKP